MKFLLDQNISPRTTKFLQDLGYDVLDTRALNLEKATDDKLWEIASKEGRIFVTFDLDFSDIRNYPLGFGAGIIIFRSVSTQSKTVNSLLKHLFDSYLPSQIKGNLVIITENRIRIRPSFQLYKTS